MPARDLHAHHLPVTIRVAASDADLHKVLAVRAATGSAAPQPGAAPMSPETWDLRPNATLLLAESRIDGEPLGSLRILASGRGRLMVEDRVTLPAALKSTPLAEASRLAVKSGRSATLVRLMLWKAFHRYCLAAQIDTMMIAVREPAARQYEWLGFHDALPGGAHFSPDGGGPGTHRLLQLGVFEAHQRSLRIGHPLHDFFFVERHPEIDLLAVVGERRAASPLPDHAGIAAQLQEMAIV